MIEIAEKFIINPENTFWGLAIFIPTVFILLYEKYKSSGIFRDVSTIPVKAKKNKLIELKECINNPIYTPKEKELFEYEIKVLEYQILLKTDISDLPTLIHLNGFENSKGAVTYYNNCKFFLMYHPVDKKFYLNEPISYSWLIRTFGIILFVSMTICAYFLMIYFLYLYEVLGINRGYIFIWVFANFVLMSFIIYIGWKIMWFYSKRQQAIELLTMKRKNTYYKINL